MGRSGPTPEAHVRALLDLIRAHSRDADEGAGVGVPAPLPHRTEDSVFGEGVDAGDPRMLYRARTVAREHLLEELGPLCFWHLHLFEIEGGTARQITAARRELHIRIQNNQIVDDLALAKWLNGR